LLDSKYKGSDGILRNTAFNSNFNVNALVGYELPVGDNSSMNFNIRFVSAGGRRIIPHDEEKTIQEGEIVYYYDQAYESSLADYFRLDVRADFKHNGPKVRHEIGMDIVNITNRPNEWEWIYNEDANKIEMIYQQGFFPYIFYRINF
jgi:UDP-3-O-acyl-N-acetylglucosamine deacetylase